MKNIFCKMFRLFKLPFVWQPVQHLRKVFFAKWLNNTSASCRNVQQCTWDVSLSVIRTCRKVKTLSNVFCAVEIKFNLCITDLHYFIKCTNNVIFHQSVKLLSFNCKCWKNIIYKVTIIDILIDFDLWSDKLTIIILFWIFSPNHVNNLNLFLFIRLLTCLVLTGLLVNW